MIECKAKEWKGWNSLSGLIVFLVVCANWRPHRYTKQHDGQMTMGCYACATQEDGNQAKRPEGGNDVSSMYHVVQSLLRVRRRAEQMHRISEG